MKALWALPWRYRESLCMVAGTLTVGLVLQYLLGQFDFFFLHRPVNYGLAVTIIIAGIALSGETRLSRWLGGIPLAVSIILGMLFLTLFMGLIPQRVSPFSVSDDFLGVTAITCSWPFVLLYGLLLLALAVVCMRRVRQHNKGTFLFLLHHGGLLIALLGAGLGAADMQRHVMHVQEGATEWRVYAENNDVLELPIAIHLHDFDIEEYPPKLAIIHREEGIPLPKGKAEWLQLGEKNVEGRLGAWDIRVVTYIHDAVWAGNNAYREMRMPGSSPAAHIEAVNRESGAVREGWVSGGNLSQFVSALTLDEAHAVVMSAPEPKRFISEISVATQAGDSKKVILEVNSPLRLGNWMIYQYGYDTSAGKLSSYSSFELVYDPWLPVVYLGFGLMSLGALGLVWSGKQKRGRM